MPFHVLYYLGQNQKVVNHLVVTQWVTKITVYLQKNFNSPNKSS